MLTTEIPVAVSRSLLATNPAMDASVRIFTQSPTGKVALSDVMEYKRALGQRFNIIEGVTRVIEAADIDPKTIPFRAIG